MDVITHWLPSLFQTRYLFELLTFCRFTIQDNAKTCGNEIGTSENWVRQGEYYTKFFVYIQHQFTNLYNMQNFEFFNYFLSYIAPMSWFNMKREVPKSIYNNLFIPALIILDTRRSLARWVVAQGKLRMEMFDLFMYRSNVFVHFAFKSFEMKRKGRRESSRSSRF